MNIQSFMRGQINFKDAQSMNKIINSLQKGGFLTARNFLRRSFEDVQGIECFQGNKMIIPDDFYLNLHRTATKLIESSSTGFFAGYYFNKTFQVATVSHLGKTHLHRIDDILNAADATDQMQVDALVLNKKQWLKHYPDVAQEGIVHNVLTCSMDKLSFELEEKCANSLEPNFDDDMLLKM